MTTKKISQSVREMQMHFIPLKAGLVRSALYAAVVSKLRVSLFQSYLILKPTLKL
jgi:hypothetical protein